MKKHILLTGICLVIFSSLGYMAGSLKYQHEASQSLKTYPQQSISKINYNLDSLINKAKQDVEGKYIESIDMKGLEELYKDIKAESVPYVFVEKIPDDFKVTKVSDQTLFMKLMTPHLLRVNEKIMRERKVILILEEKIKNNDKLTLQEEQFFKEMVEKYDVVHLKSKIAQISELVLRVDVIPVSVGLSVAIWTTNWGQKEKQSPFFEHAWDESVQYSPIKFEKLSQATESFALQLNSRSQLSQIRATRAHFRLFKNRSTFGQDLVYGLRNYAHFIPSFMDQIMLVYSLGYIKETDGACFDKGCELTK